MSIPYSVPFVSRYRDTLQGCRSVLWPVWMLDLKLSLVRIQLMQDHILLETGTPNNTMIIQYHWNLSLSYQYTVYRSCDINDPFTLAWQLQPYGNRHGIHKSSPSSTYKCFTRSPRNPFNLSLVYHIAELCTCF